MPPKKRVTKNSVGKRKLTKRTKPSAARLAAKQERPEVPPEMKKEARTWTRKTPLYYRERRRRVAEFKAMTGASYHDIGQFMLPEVGFDAISADGAWRDHKKYLEEMPEMMEVERVRAEINVKLNALYYLAIKAYNETRVKLDGKAQADLLREAREILERQAKYAGIDVEKAESANVLKIVWAGEEKSADGR